MHLTQNFIQTPSSLKEVPVRAALPPFCLVWNWEATNTKLCRFADEILIILTSPLILAPNLIDNLSKCGECQVSGLIINPQKSKALNISLSPNIQIQLYNSIKDTLLYTWTSTHISYLGFRFTANRSLCCKLPTYADTAHQPNDELVLPTIGMDGQNQSDQNVYPSQNPISL